MEETRSQYAARLFREGCNCSQSVLLAFADRFGIDRDTAMRLGSSFGGGMGRLREVCGAVSGMLMVNGLVNGNTDPTDMEARKHNYAMVQHLAGKFREAHGSIVCRELLAGAGQEAHTCPEPSARTEQYYQKRPCGQYVAFCAQLLEQELFNQPNND